MSIYEALPEDWEYEQRMYVLSQLAALHLADKAVNITLEDDSEDICLRSTT